MSGIFGNITTNSRRTFSLQVFTQNLRIKDYRERKSSMATVNETTGVKGVLQPCLTLVPPTKKDVSETEIIEFSLQVRAGSAAKNAPTYKRKVARFNGGSPAEWIEVLEALDEIFGRNGLTTP